MKPNCSRNKLLCIVKLHVNVVLEMAVFLDLPEDLFAMLLCLLVCCIILAHGCIQVGLLLLQNKV